MPRKRTSTPPSRPNSRAENTSPSGRVSAGSGDAAQRVSASRDNSPGSQTSPVRQTRGQSMTSSSSKKTVSKSSSSSKGKEAASSGGSVTFTSGGSTMTSGGSATMTSGGSATFTSSSSSMEIPEQFRLERLTMPRTPWDLDESDSDSSTGSFDSNLESHILHFEPSYHGLRRKDKKYVINTVKHMLTSVSFQLANKLYLL